MDEATGNPEPEPPQVRLETANVIKSNGNAFFKHKQWDDAARKYTAAIELLQPDPSPEMKELEFDCLLNRSACYIRMERYGSAAKDCTTVLQHDDTRVKAWFRRGEARYSMRQPHDARDDLVEALRLAPTDKHIRNLYEKANKSANDAADNKYWSENYDFVTGKFKGSAIQPLSTKPPGEQFFRAIAKANLPAALELLGAGLCDVNTVVNGYTALMSAASKGQADMVKFLVNLPDIDLHQSTPDGRCPLRAARCV
jgi:tetratricopeptide (TPR) repeat protein